MENYKNKDKLFELNVYIFRTFIRFYTYSKNSQSLIFISNSANSVLKNPCSLKHLLTVKFSYKENTACNCCRNIGHFLFVYVHLRCIANKLKEISKMLTLLPPEKFLWTPISRIVFRLKRRSELSHRRGGVKGAIATKLSKLDVCGDWKVVRCGMGVGFSRSGPLGDFSKIFQGWQKW